MENVEKIVIDVIEDAFAMMQRDMKSLRTI